LDSKTDIDRYRSKDPCHMKTAFSGSRRALPTIGKVGEAAVSTNFRRLKTQFYIGISRFLLGKRPVFFLVFFFFFFLLDSKTDIDRYRSKDPCHRKTAFSI
jgi:hypothetical protein